MIFRVSHPLQLNGNNMKFTRNDKLYMNRAIELARKGLIKNEIPVGAVVVNDSGIIGEGFNNQIELNDPTAHAEIIALKNACKHIGNYRLTRASIYVTLEPCMMCYGAILNARINKIIFGIFSKDNIFCNSKIESNSNTSIFNINYSIESIGGLEKDKNLKIFNNFFKNIRTRDI